ncbi:MAG: DUF5320 domain-containing protein [Methanomassiliicoccales archaeon]|jgi:hypothetical protein|nr:DUF5320 domain-containing protein [Methanomassiliicoccales archaeon]
MPGGDGTGPLGLGPMTGRRAGYCAGFPVPGYANPYVPPAWFYRGAAPLGYWRFGRMFRGGFARRWGCRWMRYYPPFW